MSEGITLPFPTIMDYILKCVEHDPARFTYFGIGSCPHAANPSQLSERDDQLLPAFVDSSRYSSIRVIHMDPCFDLKVDFMNEYFVNKGFVGVRESPTLWSWHRDGMEILVLADRIEHSENYSFFEKLVELTLRRANFLVVQEFTGYDTQALFQKLCAQAENKPLFRARILFDITQGTDTGCCTDLTKHTVPYDSAGNIMSYIGRPLEDLSSLIGVNEQLDRCLRRYLIRVYRQSLNSYHVDYRRRLRGESVFTDTQEYGNETDPQRIMQLLEIKLHTVCWLLIRLKIMTEHEFETLEQLFLSYKTEDVYKWYDKAFKLITPALFEIQ